jgi:hypothetical protein
MKLNQPKFITWLIALVICVLGVVLFIALDNQTIGFVVELVAAVLLLAANAVKGL